MTFSFNSLPKLFLVTFLLNSDVQFPVVFRLHIANGN